LQWKGSISVNKEFLRVAVYSYIPLSTLPLYVGQKDEPSHHNQDPPTSNAFGNDLESHHVSARVLVRSDEGKE